MRRLSLLATLLASSFHFSIAHAADGLVVYSARKVELIKPLMDDFTKETGITVEILNDEAPKLLARLDSEGANTPADLLLTADVINAQKAADKGYLKMVKSNALDASIPKEYRGTDGMWYGLSKRARVIFYNKEKVKPEELSTYEALTDPKWKGRLISRSSSSVYSQSLIASMVATHGQAYAQTWADKIAANLATPPKGGDTDLIKAVAAGEADVTFANTYYYARLLNSTVEHDKELAGKVGLFFPNQHAPKGDMDGTHVNLSTGAVIAYTKHEKEAVQLLEYLASEKGQLFYSQSNHEYPIGSHIEPSDTLQSFGMFKADSTPMPKLASYAKPAIMIADKAGWK